MCSIRACISATITILILIGMHPTSCFSQNEKEEFIQLWYAQAGEDGDGSDIMNPLGTTSEIEQTTSPNDTIFLLPSEQSFNGGLALKNGQSIIGIVRNRQFPVITNSDDNRNGGNGLVLSDNNLVQNLHIQSTHASGVYGYNTTNNRLISIKVDSANQSGVYTSLLVKLYGQPLAHGGIVLISDDRRPTQNFISDSQVLNAKGIGIATAAGKGSSARLVVSNTQIIGGEPHGTNDIGLGNLSQGPEAKSQTVLNNVTIKGRRSKVGRNVVAFATSGAFSQMKIHKSNIGFSGQDGVIAGTALLPASVDLEIIGSTIENAAQMNVEGTILNLPAYDSTRVQQTEVTISIRNSTIRNAGKQQKFKRYSRNIWVGATDMAQQLNPKSKSPFQSGTYQLNIENSRITGALDYGIGLGQERSPNNIDPEENLFDIQLKNNAIYSNGEHALVIAAPNVSINASGNCWGDKKMANDSLIRFAKPVDAFPVEITQIKPCNKFNHK